MTKNHFGSQVSIGIFAWIFLWQKNSKFSFQTRKNRDHRDLLLAGMLNQVSHTNIAFVSLAKDENEI